MAANSVSPAGPAAVPGGQMTDDELDYILGDRFWKLVVGEMTDNRKKLTDLGAVLGAIVGDVPPQTYARWKRRTIALGVVAEQPSGTIEIVTPQYTWNNLEGYPDGAWTNEAEGKSLEPYLSKALGDNGKALYSSRNSRTALEYEFGDKKPIFVLVHTYSVVNDEELRALNELVETVRSVNKEKGFGFKIGTSAVYDFARKTDYGKFHPRARPDLAAAEPKKIV